MQFGEKLAEDRWGETTPRIHTPMGIIPIVAMGRGWLLVEKPAGLSMHNAPGRDLCSTLNEELALDPDIQEKIGWDSGFGLHPVHRLDRETSGLVLLAGRRETFRQLSRQFETHKVEKRYLALVHGRVPAPAGDWGLWDRPLSPDAGGRLRPEGRGRLVECRTSYRLLRHSLHYSLIECEPLTGRKHQIRRHAKLCGHPVVGDRRYGTTRALAYLKRHCGFERLALHAAALHFQPPESARWQEFKTPGLPSEIMALLDGDGPRPADLKKGNGVVVQPPRPA
jgi:RluA family pseudouridine synthase